MSQLVVTRCPACDHEYHLPPELVGRKARCKKCRTVFVIRSAPALDDDTALAWLCDSDRPPTAGDDVAGAFADDETPAGGEDASGRHGVPSTAGSQADEAAASGEHDPWNTLDPQVRARLLQWFVPRPRERFLRFFRDTEFSQVGAAGMVLTDERIVCKVHDEREEYALARSGRVEIMRKGDLLIVHIYQVPNPPAVLKLDAPAVEALVASLRELQCRWVVLS